MTSPAANKEDMQRVSIALESLELTVGNASDAQVAVLRDLMEWVEKNKEPAQIANASGGSANINLNAGGIGVWVMLTVAAVVTALNICLLVAGTLWIGRQDREISEQGHQLNAIYMMAPHLKPKESKEVEY